MTLPLRVVLVVASILTCIYIARKLRKSQIQVMDTVFWIALAALFILLSAFPQLASTLSELMGFQAPINLVYLVVIFLLLMKVFLLSIKVSQLENRLTSLTQEIAIRGAREEK